MRKLIVGIAVVVLGVAAWLTVPAESPSPRPPEPPAPAQVATSSLPAPEAATHAVVYKSPTCGCCGNWEEHLRQNGFTVESHDMADVTPMKEELGVPRTLVSCHTAVIGPYVIEGHVPAADIERLLREHPKIAGLSAPGMPGAAPGMDSGKEPYDVIAFDASGKTSVWAKH